MIGCSTFLLDFLDNFFIFAFFLLICIKVKKVKQMLVKKKHIEAGLKKHYAHEKRSVMFNFSFVHEGRKRVDQ